MDRFLYFRNTEINQTEVEVAVTEIGIRLAAVWVTAWTPYFVISLLGISGGSFLLTPINATIPALLTKTATFVDPFIFCINRQFRVECFPLCIYLCPEDEFPPVSIPSSPVHSQIQESQENLSTGGDGETIAMRENFRSTENLSSQSTSNPKTDANCESAQLWHPLI